MSLSTSGVSLSDLSADGVVLSHEDAVAIAREAVLKAERGELSHIPAPDDLRLGADGTIAVASHLPAAASDIRRAARLLTAVLAHAAPDSTAPATFRLILARAFAEDDAAFASVEAFTDALAPFAAPDPTSAVRRTVAAWEKRHGRPETNHLSTDAAPFAIHLASERELLRETPEPAIERPSAAEGLRSTGHEEPLEHLPLQFAEPMTAAPTTAVPVAHRRARTSRAPALLAAAVLLLALFTTAWFVGVGDDGGEVQAQADATPVPEPAKEPLAPPMPQPAAAATPPPPIAGTSGVPREVTPPPPAPPVVQQRERRAAPPASASVTASRRETPDPQLRQVVASDAFSPAFTSATSGMFYHSGTGPGSAIMRADTDPGGAVLKVTRVVNDRGSNFHPRPSPDGRSIAFDSDRDGERGVYVAASDGRGVRRVSGAGFAAVPSWSPDGRRLAFVRAEERDPRVWNIWTVDVASGRMQRVTAHASGQPWGAAWFADGQWIAYSHEDRLVVRSLDGASQRIYRSPVAGRQVRTPAVSPDGRRIIFQVRRNGAWMLDLQNAAMHRVLEDPSAEEFTWSPDGRRVAYHSRRSGTWGVWMMAPR